MAAVLLPQGKQQYFTAAGVPLVGGKVFTYDTGTTTPRTTWADAAQATPNANPVILDARGEALIFWSGAYRVVIKDSLDNTIWTVDGVADGISSLRADLANAVSASLGAGMVGFGTSVAYSDGTVGGFLYRAYGRTSGEVAASVTPTYYYYPPGDIRRYGAVSGGTASVNRAAIQNALNSNSEIYIPEGTFTVDATIVWRDANVIRFASRDAILKANITSAILKGLDADTVRVYRLQVYSGTIDGTSRANAGSIGVDLASATMCKLFGTEIKNVETGVRLVGFNYGAPNETGSFYNELHAVDILTVVTGVNQGQLANSNKMFGGRINDCTYGTVDNDNTENSYYGVSIESFSQIAHRNSDTTVSILTRYVGSRIENFPAGVGTGINIGATAQDVYIEAPYFTGLVTNIVNSGARTSITGGSETFQVSGGSVYKRLSTIVVARDVAVVNAATHRQEGPFAVTGARVGDFVGVTLPASWPNALEVGPCIVTANDTVYFNLDNNTAGNIDPCPAGAENFVFFNPRTV